MPLREFRCHEGFSWRVDAPTKLWTCCSIEAGQPATVVLRDIGAGRGHRSSGMHGEDHDGVFDVPQALAMPAKQPSRPPPPNMLTDAAHLGALAPIVAVLPWARRAITARWVFDSPPLRCHSMHMTHRHLVAREFHSASRLGRRCIGNRFAQRHYDRSFQVSNSLRGVKAMRLSGRQTGPDV